MYSQDIDGDSQKPYRICWTANRLFKVRMKTPDNVWMTLKKENKCKEQDVLTL